MHIKLKGVFIPDDNHNTVENIVWVFDVAPKAKRQQHETHLQDEDAGENKVGDLQYLSQVLRLQRENKSIASEKNEYIHK